jgi:hypothetical protein
MSALADRPVVKEHPNDADAREHRAACIVHAAKTLYRDPDWICRTRVVRTGDWLRRIHYMDDHEDVILGWLEVAGINPWRPVNKLRNDQRSKLIRQMIDYSKGQAS